MSDGDGFDPRAAADAAWDQQRRARAHKPNGPDRELLRLVHYRDMRARLDGRPLVKGLLDREQTSLLVGETGSGKTFLALDLGLHVAAGVPWFGRRVTAGPVIYVAAEAGRAIENRVAAWGTHHRLEGLDIPFVAVTSPVDLCHANAGDVDRLIGAIREAGFNAPELIVIDTVSRVLAGGNENGPDDMGALVRSLDRLRDELNCHVCAVHHLGKDASRGSRGHSLLGCAIDSEIAVAREATGTIATATITKQRDGIAGQSIAFRLVPVELGQDRDGDPVTSCIVEPAEGAPAAKDKPVKRLTDAARIALDTLRKAVAEAGEPAPASNHIPPTARVVFVETWRRFHYTGTASDGQNTDSRKKAFQRAREKLQAAGAIGVHNDLCWIVADV
jgi:AAA domain-containing protein